MNLDSQKALASGALDHAIRRAMALEGCMAVRLTRTGLYCDRHTSLWWGEKDLCSTVARIVTYAAPHIPSEPTIAEADHDPNGNPIPIGAGKYLCDPPADEHEGQPELMFAEQMVANLNRKIEQGVKEIQQYIKEHDLPMVVELEMESNDE